MPRIELSEVETLLFENRMDQERLESKKIERVRARLSRLMQTSNMRNASIMGVLSKAHGVKPPKPQQPPRYSVGKNGLAVLEWDDPEPEKKPVEELREVLDATTKQRDEALELAEKAIQAINGK